MPRSKPQKVSRPRPTLQEREERMRKRMEALTLQKQIYELKSKLQSMKKDGGKT